MYNINSNVLTKTGYSAAQLEAAVLAVRHDAGFSADMYAAAVQVEASQGINALFMVAHAAVESAWGTEQIQPNNITGFNANDANPAGDASTYESQSQCITETYTFVKEVYLTAPNGQDYNGVPVGRDYCGTTIHDIFVNYSSSHDAEANTVAEIMNELESHITSTTPPPPTPAPTPSPDSGAAKHHVVSGDTLSGLCSEYPGTTVEQWVAANISQYPNMTADFIEAGWNLIIPNGTQPAPDAPTTIITVQSGDTIWGYTEKYDISRAQLKAWNITKYPQWDSNNSGFIEAGWTGVRVQ